MQTLKFGAIKTLAMETPITPTQMNMNGAACIVVGWITAIFGAVINTAPLQALSWVVSIGAGIMGMYNMYLQIQERRKKK